MLRRRTDLFLILILGIGLPLFAGVHAVSAQTNAPLTNKDVVDLKQAGVGDEVIVLRIRSSMDAADIVALKSAGISDAIMAEMLKASATGSSSNAATPKAGSLDLSRGTVILPFGSSINDPAAAGLPDATRTAVLAILRANKMFAQVGGPEEANDKKPWIEISADLVDFAGGNVATRMIIGLGTGRAHAGFDFVVKEVATGKVLWKKTVKETASFWSNSASSSAQRTELPEKVAKSFIEQLMKAKLPALQ